MGEEEGEEGGEGISNKKEKGGKGRRKYSPGLLQHHQFDFSRNKPSCRPAMRFSKLSIECGLNQTRSDWVGLFSSLR
jgi:hypothetical protein